MKIRKEEGRYELVARDGERQGGGYEFDTKANSLWDEGSGADLGGLVLEPVGGGDGVDPLPPIPGGAGGGAVAGARPCIGVLDSEIMRAMQEPWNADAFFVVPARLNGTAVPERKVTVESVGEYVGLSSASARAQVAVHPAVGQFLLDNAASSSRQSDGIYAARDLVHYLRLVGLRVSDENGFLGFPSGAGGPGPAQAFQGQLHHLRLITFLGAPVCGLQPDFKQMSRETHTVNLVFASAIPVKARSAEENAFQQEAAQDFLAVQYYGALRMAAYSPRTQTGRKAKVLMMPMGMRSCGYSIDMVAIGMARAVAMLRPEELARLDIQALSFSGIRPSEPRDLAAALRRYGALLPDNTVLGDGLGPPGPMDSGLLPHKGFRPDGSFITGNGEYGPDGMHSLHYPDTNASSAGAAGRLPRFGASEGSDVEEDAIRRQRLSFSSSSSLGRPPGHGSEVEQGWFRAESSREEQERRGTRVVQTICEGVESLWRLGLCPSRRWTNDREECDPPGLPEEVVDFPPEDTSIYVPLPKHKTTHEEADRPSPGDLVEVLQENSLGQFDPNRVGTRGLLGSVLRDDGVHRGFPAFEVQVGDHTAWYEPDWIVQDRGRPMHGDRVLVYTENLMENYDPERTGTRGMVGHVSRDYGPGPKAYDITLPNGKLLQYDEDWVARLGELPRVGDVVKVMIENPNGHFDENRLGTIGQVGTVVLDDGSDLPFLVSFKDGWSLFYGAGWIRKLPPDRLRITVAPMEGESMNDLCGDYECDPREEVCGLPLWLQNVAPGQRRHMIHSDVKGRWAVTLLPENHIRLVSRPHGGRYPQLVDQWGMLRRGTFIPVELYVQAMSLTVIPAKPAPPKKKKGTDCCGAKCNQGCSGCQEANCSGKHHTEKIQQGMPEQRVWETSGDATELNHRRTLRTTRWERLIDYSPTSGPGCSGCASLFNDTAHKTHCGRVYQGVLDNAYLVEALNAISLRPALAKSLFLGSSVEFSAYAVRLFKNGTWICVEVDDWVPVPADDSTDDSDSPFCCYSEHFPSVLWPSIVEKAYAKASTIRDSGIGAGVNNSGGWEAIGGGGRVEEALADLTGGVASTFSTRDVSSDRLFVYLYELQRDCLFVCRVNIPNANRNGMFFNPLACHAVNRAAHHEGHCFVQVFCSHPEGVFDAGLSQLTVPDALHKVYPERTEDGFFWLSILDFHFYFDTIIECRLTNSPDVGLAGMPPSRLPAAAEPAAGVPWKPDKEATSLQLQGIPLPNGLRLPTASLRPLFFEHVFATGSTVTEHKPPEFGVTLPAVPCEVVAMVEQTCPRISQVGMERPRHVAILMKVYEHIRGDAWSSELVCRSAWQPTRGAMVAFKSTHGGRFKIVAEMGPGDKCDRLIFRCYTSAPNATVTASANLKRHLVAEPEGPPAGIKWTLVGGVDASRVNRADRPTVLEPDLDDLRMRMSNSGGTGSGCLIM